MVRSFFFTLPTIPAFPFCPSTHSFASPVPRVSSLSRLPQLTRSRRRPLPVAPCRHPLPVAPRRHPLPCCSPSPHSSPRSPPPLLTAAPHRGCSRLLTTAPLFLSPPSCDRGSKVVFYEERLTAAAHRWICMRRRNNGCRAADLERRSVKQRSGGSRAPERRSNGAADLELHGGVNNFFGPILAARYDGVSRNPNVADIMEYQGRRRRAPSALPE